MNCYKILRAVIMILKFTALSAGNSLIALNQDEDSIFQPKVTSFSVCSYVFEFGASFVKSTEILKVFRNTFSSDNKLEDSSSVALHPPILVDKEGEVSIEETGAVETSLKRSPAASKLCMLGNTLISDDGQTAQDHNFLPSIILPPVFTEEEQDLSISSQLPNRRRSISGDGGWGFYGNISPGGRFYKDCQIMVH